MRKSNCLQLKAPLIVALTLAFSVGSVRLAHAQEAGGVVPASYQSGSFFNRNLGTALRFNYHTQGYGTQGDVFSVGGMKVFNLDQSTVFVDGQGTLSDDFGGGFNLGVGYRQLTDSTSPLMSIDPTRILGAGFWTDGQSTASDNFFTQLGFSLESLGESFDLRLNGSFPLERRQTSDVTLTGTGTPMYLGNNLFGATEQFTIDTAHSVVDGEFAKRIIDLEAWAFVGGYQIDGGGVDTTGYRVGVRGYAVPDLALSLQVTDDNLYSTNVMFGATWFIGRSQSGNGPCGNILDRFRDPVLRNDFIATTNRRVSRASGNALTAQGSTDAIRIVHIDDDAGAGGDGTFENPFDQISDIDQAAGNSQPGDILFVHSDSSFVGADGVATLQSNQRLLGEGIDSDGNQIPHIVATNELGNISLPETAAGAQLLSRPTINAAGADVLTLADGSSVNNFRINNAGTAVTADSVAAATGSMLANLRIDDAVNGVLLRNTTGTVVVENTVAINAATGIGLEVDGGSEGLSIGAAINDTVGRSLSIHDRTGGTIDFTGTIDDTATVAGNFSDGVLLDNNVDATTNFSNTLNIRVDDGETGIQVTSHSSTAAATPATVNATGAVDIEAAGTGTGLLVDLNDVDTAVTFADLNATAVNGDTVRLMSGGTVSLSSVDDTRTIANTGTGRAVFNEGDLATADLNANLTVNSNITNTGGGLAVEIRNRSASSALINGTVTVDDMVSAGVLVEDNEDGNILFTNTVALDTGASNAVALLNNANGGNNTAATLSFNDLDIDTSSGDGFVATGGGTLIVTSTNGTNDINVTGAGAGIDLNGMTIDAANATFDVVTVNGGAAATGINLVDLDGTGQVQIGSGTNPGDGGTLSTVGTAINVNNANNVAISNLTVSNAGAAQGVQVTGQQAGSAATFTGLEVNTANGDAVNINNNVDGTVTFSTLTAATSGAGRGFAASNGGTLVVNGTNEISSNGGAAVEIDNVESFNASNVTIANTTAQGVVVMNQDAATDSVVLSNFDVTTTTANAVSITNNTNGTVVLSGLTAESTTGDTVALSNNTGATIGVNGLVATATSSGDAFSATGGGTLTANGTNNVSAATGQGVRLDGVTVGAAGVTFADVDVSAGGTNGINLNNLSGGIVRVDGGTISTTGAAISVTGVTDALFNNLAVESSGAEGVVVDHNIATASTITFTNLGITTAAGSGNGIVVNDNGTGELDFTLRDSTVDVVAADAIGFTLITAANAGEIDIRLDGNTISADNNSAVLANLSAGTGDVQFLVNGGNDWTNSGAANATANFLVTTNRTLNATIGDQDGTAPFDENRFANTDVGGIAFNMESASGAATVSLDLRGNNASGGGTDFLLTETLGTFGVVDLTETVTNETNNSGVVDLGGGGVEGDFSNLIPPIKQVD